MKKLKTLIVIFVISLFILSLLPAQSSAAGEAIAIAVELNSFSSANTSGSTGTTLLQTAGNATTSGGALRLTADALSQKGTAVRRNQIKLTDGFSTYFQFKITSTTAPADGLAFIVYKSDTVQIGSYGEGIGYAGIGNSIIVEFDTYCNGNLSDPSSPHIAIMTNGNNSHSSQPAYIYSTLTSGNAINVWVDYNGSTGLVTVTYGTSTTRSSGTTITRNVGSALVGENVFMGFSSSTGGCKSLHEVLKWYFKDGYVSGGLSSDTNAYTQAAATVGVTLDSTSNPSTATIMVYDASGAAMSSSTGIYLDGTLVTTAAVTTSGYTYTFPELSIGSHTIRAVADGGTSNYKTFSVVAYPPTITANPSSQSVSVGDTASFSVSAASPDAGTLTYQWQVYSGGSWSNIDGATNDAYTTGTLAVTDSGKRYRCVVTNTNGDKVASANSDEATLTVNRLAGTVSITDDPSKTYDGTAVDDPAVSKNGSGSVTYTYYTDNEGSLGTLLAGAPADAGTYWVRATVAECDAYTEATATKQFAISKDSIDSESEAMSLLTYSLDPVTYNGSAQPVSVSAADGVTGLGDITVYYEGTGDTVYVKSSTAPTDAGTYIVSVDIAEGSNYGSYAGLELGTYTINKAAMTGITDGDYTGTYDGNGHSISINGVPEGATVAYRVNSSGEYTLTSMPVFTDAGTYTVDYIVTKDNYYDVTGSAQAVIGQKTFTSAMVEDISGTFTYNGAAQTPVPVVTDGTPSLIAAADYTVSYTNNTNAGTATVTVTASADGNYSGIVYKSFVIDQKELATDMIAAVAAMTYTGAEQMPVLTVTDGTPSIITAADYTIGYANNIEAGTATASITAAADGNYTGMVSVPFTVLQKELDTSMISGIASVIYNGSEQTPEFTVTDGTPSVITEADYTYAYTDNTDAGTASLTLTATADGNYTGAAVKTFTINKKALKSYMVGDIADLVYTGEALTPGVTVKDGTPSIIDKADYVISYSDNTDAGTASLTLTATADGNYTGAAVKTFTINKKALRSYMVGDIADLVYTGEALTPGVTVKDGTPSIIDKADYVISYSDNTDAGTAAVTVTARSTGNYSGSVIREFYIARAAIKGTVSMPSSVTNGDVVKADISGIAPSEAQTNLKSQWKRDGVAIKGATAAVYTATADDVGKTLTVTVTGTDNYTGSITSTGVSVVAEALFPITLTAPLFDGSTMTIGGSVTLPGEYTANISIKTLEGTTWDVLESGTYSSQNTFSVDLSNLEPGTVYIYRITAVLDGQTYTMTGRFLTPDESGSTAAASEGSISGSVQDSTGLGTAISVTIEKGNTVIASRTGLKNGDTFTFTGLPDGIYNVVANNGSYRVTKIITVEDGEAVGGVTMTIGKTQSVVAINTDDTPDVAVGGLGELFQYESMYTTADAEVVAGGGTVEIKLIAEKQEAGSINTGDKDKLDEVAAGTKIAMYLDLSVIKTVYDNSGNEAGQTSLNELADLIEVAIPIPEDLQGKSGLIIYRMHNDIAEMIPEGIENANADGEYFVSGEGYITLYVRNFCTYAIGYTEEAQGQSCMIHWWLLVILAALIVVGTIITRRNSKRIRDLEGGIEI